MDGVDERVSFEDDQEYSLEDEELSAVESDKSQNDIEINHEDLSSEKRGKSAELILYYSMFFIDFISIITLIFFLF